MKLSYEILNLIFEYNNDQYYEKWNYYYDCHHSFIKKLNKNYFSYKIENVNKHKLKYPSELNFNSNGYFDETFIIIHNFFIHRKLIMYIENCNIDNNVYYTIYKFELKNLNGKFNDFRDNNIYKPFSYAYHYKNSSNDFVLNCKKYLNDDE
jgi:hypothetical protein